MSKKTTSGIIVAAAIATATIVMTNSDTTKVAPATINYKPKFTGNPVDFIKNAYPFAVMANRQFPKVPARLILVFAALESGFGKHAPGYNFFGTKPGKSWKGKTQLLKTTEILPKATGYKFPKVYSITPVQVNGVTKYRWVVDDTFMAFDSPLEAFLNFCAFITSGRYADNYKSDGVIEIIKEIKKDGYATDPNYVEKMQKLLTTIDKAIAELF